MNTLNLNPFAARRIFDELQYAELAYLANKTPHADYLRRRSNRYKGQTRKQLDRIIALGNQAGVFVDYFLKEFGA